MGENTTGSERVTITKLERPTHAEDGPGLTAAEYRKSQIVNELSYLLWQIRDHRPGSADSDWCLAKQMYDLAEQRIQAQVTERDT